jgi:hypothetical protein
MDLGIARAVPLFFGILWERVVLEHAGSSRSSARWIATSSPASNPMGARGDAWPAPRQRVIDADILMIGTPPGLASRRALEHMDAFLGHTDARGAHAVLLERRRGGGSRQRRRRSSFRGRVVPGRSLRSGFTIPAGVTYWVGEAMGDKDYKDFAKAPKAVAEWTPMLASNAAHLARLLKRRNYPGIKGGR